MASCGSFIVPFSLFGKMTAEGGCPALSNSRQLSHRMSFRRTVDDLAGDYGCDHLCVGDFLRRAGQDVAVEGDEVGPLSDFQGTEVVLAEGGVRGVEGEGAQGLLA